MHALDFHHYLPSEDVAVLATLHLPPDWYPSHIFDSDHRGLRLNCVSSSQQESCPASDLLVGPVSNGVDIERLLTRGKKKGYAMAMGRICAEKGYHFALDGARDAGMELLLAGQVFPYPVHMQYFRQEIEPRLDGLRRFIGPLNFTRKKKLLSQAQCLVVPSTVAETSSLVAMEALACGTPVIAFRSGALPEIIEDGRTGFIVGGPEDIAPALRRIHEIDPEACRSSARSRFSGQTMAAKYIELYEQMIGQRRTPRQYVNAA